MPVVELIAVLFLVLLAATPFLTLYLLGKYKKIPDSSKTVSRRIGTAQRRVREIAKGMRKNSAKDG